MSQANQAPEFLCCRACFKVKTRLDIELVDLCEPAQRTGLPLRVSVCLGSPYRKDTALSLLGAKLFLTASWLHKVPLLFSVNFLLLSASYAILNRCGHAICTCNPSSVICTQTMQRTCQISGVILQWFTPVPRWT
jgi:hypothetical protein